MQLRLEYSLPIKTAFIAFVSLDILFLVHDIFMVHGASSESRGWFRLLSITHEGNIPTWLGSLKTVLISLVAITVAQHHRSVAPYQSVVTQQQARTWSIIAAVFFYLALDDAARVHERVGTWFGRWMSMHEPLQAFTIAFRSYHWQILFLPLLLLFVLWMTSQLWEALDEHGLLPLYSLALIGFATAIGLDYLDGLGHTMSLAAYWQIPAATVQHGFRAVEECLEMLSMSCLFLCFAYHAHCLQRHRPARRMASC